ncbi:MAG: heme a synthase [Solirubrobacteraceae bacterium]|jgi:cytochrome c oxidase assembly protein subunit 15|nr:heme a synthase [Solirubrobacteraceae bacterium]
MAVAERAGVERFTLTEGQYRRIADVALFTLTLIIFTGAAVRLTGSGLGCPNWPKCNGGFLPPLQSHQLIEYGNRMVTGVVGLPALAAAIGAYRLRPFRPELVRPALVLPLGVLAQAVLGGITVLLDLEWQVVIGHYLLSCALLVAGAVLVWRVHRGVAAEHSRGLVLATRGLAVYGGLVLVAGSFATAAGPHAGGAGTNDYVERLSGIKLDTLIHWHGHAAAVMGGLAVLLWLFARRSGASAALMKALTIACVLLAVQGIIGLIQYHNALPAGLVWVHVSLAAVLWLALVFAALAAGRARR